MDFTPDMDQRVRELYTPPYVRGLIANQAREWGCKTSDISHRGRKLGFERLSEYGEKRQRWTPEEIRLVREVPHQTCKEVRRYLQKRGFNRTYHAIETLRYRDGWRSQQERDYATVGYSAVGVAKLLGVEPSTILRWIRRGLIKAMADGNSHKCISYRIQEKALRTFLVSYVHYWNPAKVDKYWLMDILCPPRNSQ